MKFIKTFEGYYDSKTGKIIDTGDLILPAKPGSNKSSEGAPAPFLFFTDYSAPIAPPSWVKDPRKWAADELIKLLETSRESEYSELGRVRHGSVTNANIFANWISSCFLRSDPNTVPEVTKKLKSLLAELKSKDPLRSKDAVRIFFEELRSKLSEHKVSEWLESAGEFKRRDMARFEQLCSHILA
jgi:hypothetical protein